MEGTNEEDFQSFTVAQLREELMLRFLATSGLKQDLITRLVEDNRSKLQDGTMESLKQEKVRRASQMLEIESMKQQIRELQARQSPAVNPGMSVDNTNVTLAEVLTQLAQTQEIIAQKMSPTFQVFSTSDTSNAIPLFGGNRTENATEWVRQVERIAALASWSDNLTMVNASMRLRGPAYNWNTVCGKKIESWSEWKNQLIDRFKIRMSFAEFIQYQSKRILRATETVTEYIYVKNAMLEKSPSLIPEPDRVSLILEGIQDMRWSTPLATHCCKNVEELITHATAIDNIRRTQRKMTEQQETVSKPSFDKSKSNFIPKYNPSTDKIEEVTCFRCKRKGHVSYNCELQAQQSNVQPSKEKVPTKPYSTPVSNPSTSTAT
ncbi:uncharacterized protein LOC125225535 isoform X1 [Leguminivora glycinivorella]|uniref:uncharacterized protein LOC125225535 isoform X1 n=1 Tax=Leguminivora glycinivorella TaxID=1035111 RepID=UPI00200BE12F|nr:uncharacterized protein LOC125225535 isoform X1 [Leguminivora glycinivorella]